MPVSQCRVCEKSFSYYRSNHSGKYCSKRCAYKSPEWRKKQSVSKTGKTMSEENKRKVSLRFKGKKKSKESIEKLKKSLKNHWDRRGRITDEYFRIKSSNQYKQWRREVFERDGYSCVQCGDSTGGNLEADHIIPFRMIYEEFKMLKNKSILFDIENGRTLCQSCHMKTVSWGKKSSDQIEFRLLSALKLLWKMEGKGQEEWEPFYSRKVDGIIEHIKEKLG